MQAIRSDTVSLRIDEEVKKRLEKECEEKLMLKQLKQKSLL